MKSARQKRSWAIWRKRMRQSKAKTYAKAMVAAFDGVSEKEAKKRAQILKRMLYKRGDSKQISKILQEFARAWKERNGQTATVVAAEALSEKTRKQIEQSLARKKYVMEEKVDPGVIGGVALYLGNDYVIDGTIRGKLKRISKLLINSNE